MPDRISVTSAEFVRNIGFWQAEALKAPISISYHGRERLVLVAADRYVSAPKISETTTQDALHTARALLDNLSEGYVALSDQLTVRCVNRVAESHFGRPRDALVDQNLLVLFPNLQGSVLINQIQLVLRTRNTANLEVESFVVEGCRLALTIYPIPNGVGLLFSNRAERDALAATAARANALLMGIEQNHDISLANLDIRGRFTKVDDVFVRWTGFDRAALLNCRLVDLIAPAERRVVSDLFDQAATSRKPIAIETQLVRRDLRECRLKGSLSAVQNQDGRWEVLAVLTSGSLEVGRQRA